MNLSLHFSLEEFISSQTASRLGLDNTPPPLVRRTLQELAVELEGVRLLLGKPIIISSAYRSIAVNAAVGGVETSAHCMGYAADILCPQFGSPLAVAQFLAKHLVSFDQIIHEFEAWTHVSFDPQNRKQLLTIKHGTGYEPGLF